MIQITVAGGSGAESGPVYPAYTPFVFSPWVGYLVGLSLFCGALAIAAWIPVRAQLGGEITVDRPRQTVWAFVTDPRHIPLWNPRVVDVELEGGPPLKVGSTYRYVVASPQGDRRIPCRAMIVEQREPEYHRTDAKIGPLLGSIIYELEDRGNATRLTSRVVTRVPLAHWLILQATGRRRVVEDLARLKLAAEARA